MFHYYLPQVLAERTLYRDYNNKEKAIYMENGKEYTPDFINDAQNFGHYLKNNILDEKGNVNKLLASNYVRRAKLPKPRFSSQWVMSFMKRNRFSWRRGDYARHGNIDPEYVKRFMLKLARAINK